MDKVRATAHNARCGKDGPFSRNHNGRNFDVKKAEHIDPDKVKNNIYRFYGNGNNEENKTINEYEFDFYEKHFKSGLSEKNKNHLENRQYKRVRTMEDYINSKNSCPEETIIQFGKRSDINKAEGETLLKIFEIYKTWHDVTFPQAVFLDMALHRDEPDCADHIHYRKVWIAHDKIGNEIVNQGKALEEMGVERPSPDREIGRRNNAKVTYTKICREKLIEIGRSFGLEIEEKPKETSKAGLKKLDNDARMAEERRDKALAEAAAVLECLNEISDKVVKTIVPEKTGLFRKKTGKMVMNKETYEQVMDALEQINMIAKKVTETGKATEEDRAIAAEKRTEAEQSAYRQLLEIQNRVQKELAENHEAELKAKEEAEQERDKYTKMRKHTKHIIRKELEKSINDTNKAVADYLKNIQLSDGSNAYEAFMQYYSSVTDNRVRQADSLGDFCFTDNYDEKQRE